MFWLVACWLQMMEVEENRTDYILLLNNMRGNLTYSKGQVEKLRLEGQVAHSPSFLVA